MAEGQEKSNKINVIVKTPKEKVDIEIEEDASIKDFKEVVAKKFNAQPEQLCLIFAGKIMKDPETLGTHKVKDGLTVHLVIKTKTQTGSETAATTPPSAPQPSTRPGRSYFMSLILLCNLVFHFYQDMFRFKYKKYSLVIKNITSTWIKHFTNLCKKN